MDEPFDIIALNNMGFSPLTKNDPILGGKDCEKSFTKRQLP